MNITVVRAIAIESLAGLSDSELNRCRLPSGFPFLVDADTQTLIDPVFQYLWHQHRHHGKRFVANTALAEADDLRDWFQYLIYFNHDWDAVSSIEIVEYRDLMTTLVSPRTHEIYSNKTINRRLGTVLNFYRYFNKRRITAVDVSDIPNEAQAPIDQQTLAHISTRRRRLNNELLLPIDTALDDEVRAMNKRQYRLVAHALGPLPGHQKADLRPSRNRLWAELCLHTGMRPDEPAHLTIHSILDLSPENPENPLGVTYLKVVGKGNKPRKVELPNAVLKWLHWYIDYERKAAIAEGRRRGVITGRDPVALFVNGVAATHNAGNTAQYGSFQEAFRQAVLSAAVADGQTAGLMRTVQKIEPTTQQFYTQKELAFSPHCLRHTFAVWTYLAEKQAGNAEPWKRIQVLLGHAHLSTTMNTYLRVASEFEAQLSDRAQGYLTDLLNRGQECLKTK